VAGLTAVVSLAIGGLAGSSLMRSVSVGFYSVGALLLVGCFLQGARGPLRPVWRDDRRGAGFLGPRGVRKASPLERSEAGRTSILLFAMGMALIALGAALDPERRTA
jgi:hypothetical protein